MSKKTTVTKFTKSDYQKRKEKYKFELREDVMYVGKVYDQYIGKIGNVQTRLSPRGKIWYHVIFEDGKRLELMESMLERFGDKVEEGSVEG